MKVNRTIWRTVELLKLLANNPKGLTASELRDKLQIPKSSTFDIINTLRTCNFIFQFGRRFYIGSMAQEIGEAYSPSTSICFISEALITQLVRKNGVSCSLVFYNDGKLEYALVKRPEGCIISPERLIRDSYIHAAASGKVLLAWISKNRLKKILPQLSYKKFTKNTLKNEQEFLQELNRVREQGFAIDNKEFNELLTCISVPLFNKKKIIAALTFSDIHIKKKHINQLVKELKVTAEKIEEKLTKEWNV
ncbi:MAG: hypothetical protein CSB23_01290 [Deltaproteobacteria bacterium]|nr:MAG: hypothetical protein CSB23_01290 [Deltaproteobacteria bacterium]